MPANIYVHLTWTTDGRTPMLGQKEERFLRTFLPAEARQHKAQLVSLGIVTNHVHVLLFLPTKIDIPRIVQGFKGGSSRLINKDRTNCNYYLKWASGYDIRSVSPTHVDRVIAYIRGQSARHPNLAITGRIDRGGGSSG